MVWSNEAITAARRSSVRRKPTGQNTARHIQARTKVSRDAVSKHKAPRTGAAGEIVTWVPANTFCKAPHLRDEIINLVFRQAPIWPVSIRIVNVWHRSSSDRRNHCTVDCEFEMCHSKDTVRIHVVRDCAKARRRSRRYRRKCLQCGTVCTFSY